MYEEQRPKVGSWSPWGPIQHVEDMGEGAWFCSTSSHGGAFLCRELNRKMPMMFRRSPYGDPMKGWYEEDAQICLVFLVFPELVKPRKGMTPADCETEIRATLRRSYPNCLEEWERIQAIRNLEARRAVG